MKRVIGFLGLGKMGLPMAKNLAQADQTLIAFDPRPDPCAELRGNGTTCVSSMDEVIVAADVIISVLPGGTGHRATFLGEAGILARARKEQLYIDCSTADVSLARDIAMAAHQANAEAIDAPISGGVRGAEMGKLTFMVGGSSRAVERARPLLEIMGSKIVHAGEAGLGQAAKICNNLMVGISTIGMCEAFALAERLGLSAGMLFEVAKTAAAQSWVVSNLCPVPGIVPTSPASNGYRPGGAAALLLKDLHLAQTAAHEVGVSSPLGAAAEALYRLFCSNGGGELDSTAIIKLISGRWPAASEIPKT
jgi:3-hydroxyisobutyrate dehydrogenase